MPGRIAVVDERDRFVRWTERAEIHRDRLPHRSVHVLVFDAANHLIVQRRHRDKQVWPGFWDASASGHVEESDYLAGPDERLDEVYDAVARRELLEELGVDAEVERLGTFRCDPPVHYETFRLYRAFSDGPYVLQAEEVEDVRSVTFEDLEAMKRSGEPITSTLWMLVGWVRERGLWA